MEEDPDTARSQAAALLSMTEGITDRFEVWKQYETAERISLWFGRFLLVAPVSGAVLTFLYFRDPENPALTLLLTFVGVYVQGLAFFNQFMNVESRWARYQQAGADIAREALDLQALIKSLRQE